MTRSLLFLLFYGAWWFIDTKTTFKAVKGSRTPIYVVWAIAMVYQLILPFSVKINPLILIDLTFGWVDRLVTIN